MRVMAVSESEVAGEFDTRPTLPTELYEVGMEVRRAEAKFPPFNSAHEGWAVLQEEVDEMWDAIKENDVEHARKEAVQVAAMAVRFRL